MPLKPLGVLLLILVAFTAHGEALTRDTGRLHLASVHAAVVDLDEGVMLYAKHADRPVPIASVTKLMTALVVLDSGADLDEQLTVVEREREAANNAYSRIRPGSTMARGGLLRLALMSSENRAAYNLAHYHPGGFDAFVAAMNRKAEALEMHRSRFVDPTGLSPRNRATAADLIRLLTAALAREEIRDYTQTGSYTARFGNPAYTLPYGNTNPLVRRAGWDVLVSKTGYLDEAGRCLATVVRVDGRRYGVVVLNAFGRLTPIGDIGRIRRWLVEGEGGRVAGPALAYERRKTAPLEADLPRVVRMAGEDDTTTAALTR